MSDWIEWSGGECPVDGDTRVECKLREGVVGEGVVGEGIARYYDWSHLPDEWAATRDIIAYKVIEQ